MKKKKKYIIILIVISIILLIFFGINAKKYNIQSISKIINNEGNNFESNVYKKISKDEYVTLLTIASENGIDEISYLDENNNDVILYCYGKKEVTIDYQAKNYTDYYFNIKDINGYSEVKKLYLEQQDSNILYDTGMINTDKILGFKGVNNYACTYEIGSTYLRSYSSSATYNDCTIYTTNKVDMTGYTYLKAELSTGSNVGGSNFAMLLACSTNTSSYPMGLSTYQSEKVTTNNSNNIIVTVDISKLTEPMYIGLFNCMGEGKWTKIWLE